MKEHLKIQQLLNKPLLMEHAAACKIFGSLKHQLGDVALVDMAGEVIDAEKPRI